MASSHLSNPIFRNDEAARVWLEAQLWPNGPVCPHCGEREKIRRLQGKSHRPGLCKCYACQGHFTVTVGTVFERSKVPLHKWMLAVFVLCGSKKGFSSHQLHRTLGVTYKTAWFMSHRIREAMKTGGLDPLGGTGAVVEADETYYGPKAEKKSEGTRGPANKRPVVALVERGGEVRTFHVARADKETVDRIVRENVNCESRLVTDESKLYREVGAEMAGHETVCHSAEEYVRGDAHTNTIEGYFSIFKRGMKGVYQHCAEKHLNRYLAEFDFRYNNRVRLGDKDLRRRELDRDVVDSIGMEIWQTLSQDEQKVAAYAATNQTVNVSEVQRTIGRTWKTVKSVLPKLEKKGILRFVKPRFSRDPLSH